MTVRHGVVALALTVVASGPALAQACIDVPTDGHPNLFLNDRFVATSSNIVTEMHHPTRNAEPVLGAWDRPDRDLLSEGEPGRNFWPMVVQDEVTGELRAYTMIYNYQGPTSVVPEGGRSVVALSYRPLSSPLDWSAPSQAVFATDGFIHSLVDRGASAPAEERYVAVYYDIPRPGTSLAYSPDGVTWTPDPDNPVIPALPINDPDPAWLAGPMDIADLFYDEERGVWRLLVKALTGPGGQQSRTMDAGWGIRVTDQYESADLKTWTLVGPAFRPQPFDEGTTEFYGAAVLPVGDMFVAFIRMLRDDASAEAEGAMDGVGYTSIAYSEDGETWTRLPEPYLDRASEPGAFDRANAWVSGAFVVGDTLYLPYSGYGSGHKVGSRETGVATTLKDRFVGRRSDDGTLKTPLLCFDEAPESLTINADATSGTIDYRLLDANGDPLPGFGFEDCADLNGDGVALAAQCATPLGPEKTSFRIEFKLTNATLFAFALN